LKLAFQHWMREEEEGDWIRICQGSKNSI
jgi:hypothetical protein